VQLNPEEILINGKALRINSLEHEGVKLIIEGNLIKTAKLLEEWYDDVLEPESIIRVLKDLPEKPDIFTFWQRLPATEPKYQYYVEWESVAAIPIKSYKQWWEKQISSKTRNMVRKAEKSGVIIKKTDFDDECIRGMANIFNENPIRQGKRFWHYGKNMDMIKKEFSRFLYREEIVGAYLNNELIGFIMLCFAGQYAILGQIISKIEHRDKAPNNALIAKAVEICAELKIPYLTYGAWRRGTLGDFQSHNGFEEFLLPRYYIPLTMKGNLMILLKLHNGIKTIIPENIVLRFVELRAKWYSFKYGQAIK
jgi:hypothetical protein